jgi:hypothetical protein
MPPCAYVDWALVADTHPLVENQKIQAGVLFRPPEAALYAMHSPLEAAQAFAAWICETYRRREFGAYIIERRPRERDNGRQAGPTYALSPIIAGDRGVVTADQFDRLLACTEVFLGNAYDWDLVSDVHFHTHDQSDPEYAQAYPFPHQPPGGYGDVFSLPDWTYPSAGDVAGLRWSARELYGGRDEAFVVTPQCAVMSYNTKGDLECYDEGRGTCPDLDDPTERLIAGAQTAIFETDDQGDWVIGDPKRFAYWNSGCDLHCSLRLSCGASNRRGVVSCELKRLPADDPRNRQAVDAFELPRNVALSWGGPRAGL